MFGELRDLLTGGGNETTTKKVKGTVVLMKKNVLDFNDFNASFLDRLHEFLGNKITLRLVSSDVTDSGKKQNLNFLNFEIFQFCLLRLFF